MVDANLKIIAELKCFLQTVSKDVETRKLFTQSATDFSRNRKLTLARLAGLIINMPKRSLSIEIQEFFDIIKEGENPSTKGAFSQQRSKLQPLFFQMWNKCLVDCFYEYYEKKVKCWRGFRLQAVDGSTVYLVNTKEVIEYFGTQDNQYVGVPMARVMQIQDILNGITVLGDIFPILFSEQAIVAYWANMNAFYEDTLTMFDRGFPGYALMYLMMNQESPRHFVMRCKAGFNKEVRAFMKSSKKSKIVTLTPTPDAIATLREHGYIVTSDTGIKVRMVKIKLSTGETEVLLTNLYDERLYTLEDLKYLYGLRWGIETAYGKQKNQLQMEQFSGHRVICIQQDYAANVFVANLQSLIEKQCEPYLRKVNIDRKHEYRVNKNVSWASLKHNIVRLFLEATTEDILLYLQKRFERNVEPVRPGRKYSRVRKAKRHKGKFQTCTNYKRAI